MEKMLGAHKLETLGIFVPSRVSALVRKWKGGRLTSARDNMAFMGVLSAQLLAQQFGSDLERRVRSRTLAPGMIAWRGAKKTD